MQFSLPLLLLAIAPVCFSQTVSLRGQITDETGAIIQGASVTLNGPARFASSVKSGIDGSYSFTGLAAGDYTVAASTADLTLPKPVKISLKQAANTLNLQLKINVKSEQLSVSENTGPAVGADPNSNASALVLRGDDLQALADNPEDLAADLQALAGPSAGPNGGAIFVDGFSGGELPSKESIREIRINQNPFSSEYDKLGFGRIEIFTKPGTDKFRGTTFYNFGDDFWNSRNPYAQEKAPFLLKEYGGNLSGPIGKRASFFVDLQRHAIDNGAIINGTTLDPETLAIVNPYTGVLAIPQRRLMVNPRADYQINASHTLVARYGFTRADVEDSGVGGFNLPSRGYHAHTTSHTAQTTETAVLSTKVINETRFQYYRLAGSRIANDSSPTLQVLGAFTGGGAQVGHSSDVTNSYELQNYTTLIAGSHSLRFGVRLRGEVLDSASPQNFGGTFTFGGGLAPVLDSNNQPVAGAPQINITSIERYRRTKEFQREGLPVAQIRALGGGATQFTINGGVPFLSVSQFDAGLFIGDDWRIRPNLTVSFGLRYETQTNVPDRRDLAPRFSFAWAPGAARGKVRAKNVIRAGSGVFYDRFPLTNTLAAKRYDGVQQQQYVVTDPNFFPVVPQLSDVAAVRPPQTIQTISSTLRAPYIIQSAIAFERQLPGKTTVAITYANSHGLHMLRSQAINAPLPGSGEFPQGTPDAVFLMDSSGLYNQNQIITNVNSNINSKFSMFGSYVYNHARSNTDGLSTFPAKPYSFTGEYGPAATDMRHRVSFGGAITTWRAIRLSPLFTAETGPPFDITVGRDLYGDTLFNGRPSIAASSNQPGVVATTYGLLNPNPLPGETLLSRNFGRGPGQIMMNLRIAKTFTIGRSKEASGGPAVALPGDGRRQSTGVFNPGAGGGAPAAVSTGRRYNITISMSIRNILNHNNPGAIIGNITSPLFGQANQIAGAGVLGGTGFSEAANNRRLELQTRFTF